MKKIIQLALLSGLVALLPTNVFATSVVELPELTGEITGDRAGGSVATGDVNGDGYDDLLVGADGYHDDGGAVYLFYGSETLITDASLSTADAVISGTAAQYAGTNVTSGDINGDGYDDIMVNQIHYLDSGNDVGAVYVVYGQAEALSSSVLSSKNGAKLLVKLPVLVLVKLLVQLI